jgi:transposase
MKITDPGTVPTHAPCTGRPGRPSKRRPQVVEVFLKQLSAGESRRRAAQFVQVSPKTIQRWLRDDAKFRKSVRKAEREGQDKAR